MALKRNSRLFRYSPRPKSERKKEKVILRRLPALLAALLILSCGTTPRSRPRQEGAVDSPRPATGVRQSLECPDLIDWTEDTQVAFALSDDELSDEMLLLLEEDPCEALRRITDEYEANSLPVDRPSEDAEPDKYLVVEDLQEWAEEYRDAWAAVSADPDQREHATGLALSYFGYEEANAEGQLTRDPESRSRASVPEPVRAAEAFLKVDESPPRTVGDVPSPAEALGYTGERVMRLREEVAQYWVERASATYEPEDRPDEALPLDSPQTLPPLPPPPPKPPRKKSLSVIDVFPDYYTADDHPYWPPQETQTTELMQGTVQPVVFFLEKNGRFTYGDDGFPMDQRQRFRKIFSDGVRHWIAQTRKRNVSLVFRKPVEYSINMRAFDTDPSKWTEGEMVYTSFDQSGLWQKHFSQRLQKHRWSGYDQSKRLLDIQLLADRVRKDYGTDWAFFIFAAYPGNALNPAFTVDSVRLGAYVIQTNSSALFMNFTWWGFGINEYVIPHEIGHVFGAEDHYNEKLPCTSRAGYLGTATKIQYEKPAHLRTYHCRSYQPDIMDGWFRNKFKFTGQTLNQVGMRRLDKERPQLEVAVVTAFDLLPHQRLYCYNVAYRAEVGAPMKGENPWAFGVKRKDLTPTHIASIRWQDRHGSWVDVPVSRFRFHKKRSMNYQRQYGVLLIGRWGETIERHRFEVTDSRGRVARVDLRGSYQGKEWQPGDRAKSQ